MTETLNRHALHREFRFLRYKVFFLTPSLFLACTHGLRLKKLTGELSDRIKAIRFIPSTAAYNPVEGCRLRFYSISVRKKNKNYKYIRSIHHLVPFTTNSHHSRSISLLKYVTNRKEMQSHSDKCKSHVFKCCKQAPFMKGKKERKKER